MGSHLNGIARANQTALDYAAQDAAPPPHLIPEAHSNCFEVVTRLTGNGDFQDHFAANTNDISTVLSLLTSSDAVAPSTDVAVVTALRAGTVVQLDVYPPLDIHLTLGIVERAGRTRVPAVERAFRIVRAHFGAVAREIELHMRRPKSRRNVGRQGRD